MSGGHRVDVCVACGRQRPIAGEHRCSVCYARLRRQYWADELERYFEDHPTYGAAYGHAAEMVPR